jgi:hypothetical protein
MHINWLTNPPQHGDCQSTTQMLSELLQTIEHSLGLAKYRVVLQESEPFKGFKDLLSGGPWQAVDKGRINGVKRHTYRDGFAMSQSELAERFHFVGGPVAVVERAGFEHFEGIASGRDVPEVPAGRLFDCGPAFRGTTDDGFRVLVQPAEEFRILQQGHLDCF